MKKYALLLFMLAGITYAQTTTTYTGTIKDLTGTVVTSGRVTFTLQPGIDTTISGRSRFVSNTVSCPINSSGGVFSSTGGACTVINNTALTPSGTYYKINIQPYYSSPGSFLTTYAIGGTVDISTLVPTPATSPAYNYITSSGGTFTGPVTIPTLLGPVSVGGAITSPSMNSILNAQLATGSTPEQQIENAAATLPNAGIVFATPTMGGGNWNDPVFPVAPAGVTIWDTRQLNRASNLLSVNLGGNNQLSYGIKIRTKGQSSASGNSDGITSCSVNGSNVATVYAGNAYSAGNLVWIWQLSGGCAFLNNTLYGLPYTVLSATGTSFTVAVTHATLGVTSDFGQTGAYATAGYGVLADVTLSGDSPNVSALGGFCATANSGCTYGANFGNGSGFAGAGTQGDLGPGLLGGSGIAGTTGTPTGGSVAYPQFAAKGYALGTTSGYAIGGGFFSKTAPALWLEQDDTSTSANTKYISKQFSQQPNGAMEYLAPYISSGVGPAVWTYGVTGNGALNGLPFGDFVIQVGDTGKQFYIDTSGNLTIGGTLTAKMASISVPNINAITSNWSFYTALAQTGGTTLPAAGSQQTFGNTCPWNSNTDCMELTDITQATSTQTNILATYKGITPNNNHTNFTNSFTMYYTGTPSSLEFDVPFFNTQTQTDYMFGVQCNLATGHLQIDNQNTSWKDATGPVSCTALTASAAHTISYTVHFVPFDTNGCTSMACLSFDSFTLDGVTSTNLGTEPANTLTYTFTGLEGPQFQVDIGSTSGTPKTVNAWYENNTFTASSTCPNGVCSPVSIGFFTLAAGATTATVTSPYVTANSIIEPIFDSSLSSRLGVTCNTTNPAGNVSSRTPGTSFVLTGAAPTTNPACYSYRISY